MNNKGFAITSFLYAILIAFLLVFGILLINIINTKLTLDYMKKNVKSKLEDDIYVIEEDYAEIVVEPQKIFRGIGAEIDLLEGVYLRKYDGEILTNSISYTSDPAFDNNTIGVYIINYEASLNGENFKNYRVIEIGEMQ